jgi:hypothetical protein
MGFRIGKICRGQELHAEPRVMWRHDRARTKNAWEDKRDVCETPSCPKVVADRCRSWQRPVIGLAKYAELSATQRNWPNSHTRIEGVT